MESVDQQLQQLKENYEHMTEEELCAIAENAYDLTEIAREALQAVITEKGIAVRLKLEPPPSAEPPEDEDLVIFVRPKSAEEAGRTMETLAAAGIPSFLSLEVRADDLKRAEAALYPAENDDDQQEQEEEPEDSEDKTAFAMFCPKCHSDAVVLRNCERAPGASPQDTKYNWSCDACGHQWKDEGIEQEVPAGQAFHSDDEEDENRDSDE